MKDSKAIGNTVPPYSPKNVKSSQINVIRSEMNNANMLVEKINSLNFCPLCKQNVSEMHKHSIKEEENKKNKYVFGQTAPRAITAFRSKT